MTNYLEQATIYADRLRELLTDPENVEAIDEIFEADLVRSQSFEIIGKDQSVIVLRDASGFDVLLTVTCERITDIRTSAIEAAKSARAQTDGEEQSEIIDSYPQ